MSRRPGRVVVLFLLGVACGAGAPARASSSKSILWGDLHVHTTYSIDAFLFALPLFGGEGAHPPADACDFARYCAALDFFSLNDHAESLTPARWQETKESVRQCNARAGDPRNPDLVAFTGWEWTQTGATPETHFGHKNVIFRGTGDAELPARPITALSPDVFAGAPSRWLLRAPQLLRVVGLGAYADFFSLIAELADLPNCPSGIDTRQLPHDCRENAPLPDELFEKLSQWGFDALVIPHGLAWGIHAPVDATLGTLLARGHDPGRERLLEIFSGHGNSEEYRGWRGSTHDGAGGSICPAPTADFLPCCWRAGEIMRARCGDLSASACEARVEEAKRLALQANIAPHRVFPDTRPEDWLDCDQCRNCFKPAFTLRPTESAQYGLALSDFDHASAGRPRRLRWGFIASSDNHSGRPGTGYKQIGRQFMTDARGIRSPLMARLLRPRIVGRQDDPRRPQTPAPTARSLTSLFDNERGASFLYPGGLVGVHADGRSRDAIWAALQRREVFGTSGPRIALWFDLINAQGGRAPMGSEVVLAGTPRFEVRALGARVQRPGCPAGGSPGLPAERLERLCHGECYNPGDARHRIVAVEVIRVRPQVVRDEPTDALIQDPWRHFDCPPDPNGCVVRFDDPDYATAQRDSVYYVRALQEPTPAINGAGYRTEFDTSGNPVRIRPCDADYRTAAEDDCLAPVEERAWSSPIFVDRP
jgi:Protein of unknown function (DUF3604)